MKKILLSAIIIAFYIPLKAQQLKTFTPVDSLLNQSLDNYARSKPGLQLLKPDYSLNQVMAALNEKKNTNMIGSPVDHMPIAVLGGNYKMPVAKLKDNARMPVLVLGLKPIFPEKQLSADSLLHFKQPVLLKIPGR